MATYTAVDGKNECGHKHRSENAARACSPDAADIRENPSAPKYKSRATRLDEATSAIGTAASTIDDLKSEIEALLTDEDDEQVFDLETYNAKLPEFTASLVSACTDLNSGKSELEALKEEIEAWRDNMEEHFSQTEKYSALDTAADALEEAVSNCEEAEGSEPSLPEDPTFESMTKFVEDLDTYHDNLESAAECDVEMPTAY